MKITHPELQPEYLKLLKSYYGLIAENISLRFNLTDHVKLEETMSKKELESPNKEQVLKAAESCPDAEVALKELYPSVFKEEHEYCCDLLAYAANEGYVYKTCSGHYTAYLAKQNAANYLERILDYCPWCGKKLS